MSFKNIVALHISSFIKRANYVFNWITSYLVRFESAVSQNKTQFVLLIAIVFGVFLRCYNLSYFHFMTADECVYTQAVYAITKGYVPYRDVFIAHPPMHFLIEYFFMLINVSLPMVRFVSVLLSLGTILTLFFATRALFSSKVAKIATILFALAPYAIFFNKLAIVENTLLFFTTLTLFLFFKYYKDSDRKYLLLSAFFAGIAAISKYTMLFLVVVLMAFVIFRKEFKNLVLFIACAGIAPSILLLMLLFSGTYNIFYIQTIGLQLIRFNLPLSLKVWELTLYVIWTGPLLILALITMIRKREKEDVLLVFLNIVPFLIMFSGKTFFAHYPLMLAPALSILAARSLESFSLPKRSTRKELYVILMMTIFLSHFLIFSFLFLIPSMEFDVRKKMEAAAYIRGITNETDKIWTTEADIAFFCWENDSDSAFRSVEISGILRGSVGLFRQNLHRSVH